MKSTLSIVDRMQAAKTVEEVLRPNLPAVIKPTQTWLLEAQRIMNEAPEVYAGIAGRLADGDTNQSISKLTKLPLGLIRKIRELHPAFIEAGRRAANARIEEALHASADRLAKEIAQIPIRQLPVATAILFDKVQLATGQATSRHEIVKAPTKEDLDAYFNTVPQVTVITEEKK